MIIIEMKEILNMEEAFMDQEIIIKKEEDINSNSIIL
jgi:hypothetical protein